MAERVDPIFEPLTMGSHQMPGIWRYLFPEDFYWLQLPDERHATCDSCYKVKFGVFRDDCRCCTYFPELANFSLGLALLGDSRQAVLDLVPQRLLLPFGMAPSPMRYHRIVEAHAYDLFGEVPWMVCPFVEPSTFHCRIYAYRNSICSTFFCVNDHGKIGEAFWGKTQDLVGQVETAIAQWCMDEVGSSHETYVARLDALAQDLPAMSEPETMAWSQHAYATLWDEWLGKEVEFFEACARLVMEHRDDLYDIAREQAGRDALQYESIVREQVPTEHRHEAPRVADENTDHRPIDDLWYKLSLIERRVWELPFHEGPVVVSDAVEIIDNPRDDAWTRDAAQPFMVRRKDPQLRPKILELFDADEIALLRLFEGPRRVDEHLFGRPEMARLDSPRRFLAQCLRQGILEIRK